MNIVDPFTIPIYFAIFIEQFDLKLVLNASYKQADLIFQSNCKIFVTHIYAQ